MLWIFNASIMNIQREQHEYSTRATTQSWVAIGWQPATWLKVSLACHKNCENTSEYCSQALLGRLCGISLLELFHLISQAMLASNLGSIASCCGWHANKASPYFFGRGIQIDMSVQRKLDWIPMFQLRVDAGSMAYNRWLSICVTHVQSREEINDACGLRHRPRVYFIPS